MNPKRSLHGLYAPELLEARIAPATFTVTSLLDNGLDGTLRKEIADANLLIGADTIVFKIAAPETLPGIIKVKALGEILISDALTIKGPGIDLLTVTGEEMVRIFRIDYTTASLAPTIISGLTLTDGKTAANGGAIYSKEPLSLKNVVVRSSAAGNDGGGVWVTTAGKISIAGSHIVHNTATAGSGGLYLIGNAGVSIVKTTVANNTALFNGGLYAGASSAKATVLIDTSVIANNKATSSNAGGLGLDSDNGGKIIVKNSLISGNSAIDQGGGLVVSNFGNFVISKTTFSNNTAARGGAIAGSEPASLTISGSRFLGNSATTATGGGALYLAGPAPVKVTGSLFSGNTSTGDGGAITATNELTLAITGSSFLGNAADFSGGALAIGNGAVLTMKSSILSGNSAEDGGGAIFVFDGSVVNLTGNKFTENQSDGGGGALYLIANANASTATLSGNLFQGNVAGTIGGAIRAVDDCIFSSKSDKFIANVAATGQGGGVHLVNTGGIVITGSLFQSNVAGSSGGGLGIGASATLTSLKVLDNIAGPGGIGGGLRISGGVVQILKSIITGNVADRGGGILFNVGTTTIDAATKVTGNAAATDPNIGTI